MRGHSVMVKIISLEVTRVLKVHTNNVYLIYV